MRFADAIKDKLALLATVESRLARIQESIARMEARQLAMMGANTVHGNEFRAFSQWGEDGIIQFLLREIEIDRRVFVEFGVETYLESNTRFLLVNNNWSGLVIDGGEDNIRFIKNDPIFWRYNLKAECAFITRDNINEILERNGVGGEIGLLSVDIDGNDYWVWKAIDVVRPVLVIVEYNARFGPVAEVTVPYDANFVRGGAHHSMIYYGASLGALRTLGDDKGYALVGCNSNGNNAFFVRKDRVPASLRPLTAQEAFVPNQFREARDGSGQLSFLPPEQEYSLIQGLPLVDVSR